MADMSPLERLIAHHLSEAHKAIEADPNASVSDRIALVNAALETVKQFPAMGIDIPVIPQSELDRESLAG